MKKKEHPDHIITIHIAAPCKECGVSTGDDQHPCHAITGEGFFCARHCPECRGLFEAVESL